MKIWLYCFHKVSNQLTLNIFFLQLHFLWCYYYYFRIRFKYLCIQQQYLPSKLTIRIVHQIFSYTPVPIYAGHVKKSNLTFFSIYLYTGANLIKSLTLIYFLVRRFSGREKFHKARSANTHTHTPRNNNTNNIHCRRKIQRRRSSKIRRPDHVSRGTVPGRDSRFLGSSR